MSIPKIKRTNPLHSALKNKYPAEYRAWSGMKQRCYNPKEKYYSIYGGRGIKVCDVWLGENGFIDFMEHMGQRPPKHSIDRINNDGNYEPGNCRWATKLEQSYNSRRIKYITINGDARSVSQWIRHIGINHSSYYERLKKGMTPEQAITTPITPRKKLTF